MRSARYWLVCILTSVAWSSGACSDSRARCAHRPPPSSVDGGGPRNILAVELYRAAREDLGSELPEEVEHAVATLTRAGDAATLWLLDTVLYSSTASTVSRALKILRRIRPALAAYLRERGTSQREDLAEVTLSDLYRKFGLHTSRTPSEWAGVLEDERRWRSGEHARAALAAYGLAAKPIVEKWARSQEAPRRDAAARLVAEMVDANPLYIAVISPLATDGDLMVRKRAAMAMARLSGESSALSALRQLSADPNPSVRRIVFVSLDAFQSEVEVALEFGEGGLEDEDAGVRFAALTLLVARVDHPPVRLLPSLERALTEKDSVVAAATLVGRMGTTARTAIESLEKARDGTTNWTEIDAIEAAMRAVGGDGGGR